MSSLVYFLCRFKQINHYSKRGLKTRLPHISNTNNIRNVGIIAHIDSGKTTLTEQLLYQTGTTQAVGFVDEGNTITDFMEIERERGITIQSASISTSWRDHRINLIDTPGHVDFTIEVERSLRVLDGAVTVLDASAGVQAQTLTVWRQANKFNLPSIFFINKMDKPYADLNFCLASIEERLNTKVIPVVLPFFNTKNGLMEGFVDVLNNRFLKFTKMDRLIKNDKIELSKTLDWINIPSNSQIEQTFISGLEDICLSIADVDSEFEKQITAQNLRNIPKETIIKALRSSTMARKLSPVACGSALHNSSCVLPVLDMIVDFLPSPYDQKHFKNTCDESVKSCGIVFKVSHDLKEGQLNYVRLFKGNIDSPNTSNRRHSLINANTDELQNNYKIFTPFSDYLQPIERVEEGNIAVITGLNNTKTGDTLITCNSSCKLKSFANFALEGIEAPSPVFSCTIESPNLASERQFLNALSELLVEDPSLQIREDPNTGQKILEGMGELQIEVLRERLHREYKLDVFIGPLRINYRESPTKSAEFTELVEDSLSQRIQKPWNSLKFYIEPLTTCDDIIILEAGHETFSGIELSLESENLEEVEAANKVLTSRPDLLKAINDGCSVALFNGPKMGFPVTNVKVFLKSFTFSGRLQPTLLSACASRCLSGALKNSAITMLEPLMKIEVTIIAGISGSPDVDNILKELSKRRARITGVGSQRKTAIITAKIPLSETIGLSKVLRTISSGLASFNLEQKGYQTVELENDCFRKTL